MKRKGSDNLQNLPPRKRLRTSSFSVISCDKIYDEIIKGASQLYDYYKDEVRKLDIEYEMRSARLSLERDQLKGILEDTLRTR